MNISPELYFALRRWRTALHCMAMLPKNAPFTPAQRERRYKGYAIETDCMIRVACLLNEEESLKTTLREKKPRRTRRDDSDCASDTGGNQ